MYNINLNLLEEFIVLARRLNYSAAAKELCMAQSSLSKHMTELERRIGVVLINRDFRITLTPAGKLFLREATALLHDFDETVTRCRELQSQKVHRIRMQEIELWTTPVYTLYSILQSMKKDKPSASVCFVSLNSKSIVEGLKENVVDAGIALHAATTQDVIERYEAEGLLAVRLCTEPVVLWTSVNNPILKNDHLSIRDLENTRIITSSGQRYDIMRPLITELCENVGFTPIYEDWNISSITEFFMIDADYRSVFILTPKTLEDGRVSERKDMTYRILEGEESFVSAYLLASDKGDGGRDISSFFSYVKELLESDLV